MNIQRWNFDRARKVGNSMNVFLLIFVKQIKEKFPEFPKPFENIFFPYFTTIPGGSGEFYAAFPFLLASFLP